MAEIKLEVIGDNYHAYMSALNRGKIRNVRIRDMCQAMKYGQSRFYPSVTRVEGNSRQRIRRMMKDYSHAERLGERGIFDWYALGPGQYEIRECIALGTMRTKHISVNQDGSISEGNNA